MNDRSAPNPATTPTGSSAAEWLWLYQTIEGWIDADVVLPAEGEALLAAVDAARRSLEKSGAEACRRRLRRLVRTIEALVRSGLLAETHGNPALEAAQCLLQDSAG